MIMDTSDGLGLLSGQSLWQHVNHVNIEHVFTGIHACKDMLFLVSSFMLKSSYFFPLTTRSCECEFNL